MDTMIEIKIYSKNKSVASKTLDGVEDIYRTYHELSDKYNAYDDIINIYAINHKTRDDEYLKIDERLYQLIQYGLDWKNKSNGLLDINMGCVIDKWKSYFDLANGVPSLSELKSCQANPVVLERDNTILNNSPSIDLGAISKGYATMVAGKYLEDNGITKYLINAGGNVLAGDHYNNNQYKIGIENPNDKSVYKVLNVTNKAIVTSGGYERFYEYEGVRYNHIINPKTLYPANYVKSVTVISEDSALADALTTTLFLMPVEDGQKFVSNMNVEVIWYTNDDQIITTKKVGDYE